MLHEGLLRVIGDIIMSENDCLVLVCVFSLFSGLFHSLTLCAHSLYILSGLYFIQKVTLLLSSAIVAQWGLDTQDREEVTRDMIGTILRMIMV